MEVNKLDAFELKDDEGHRPTFTGNDVHLLGESNDSESFPADRDWTDSFSLLPLEESQKKIEEYKQALEQRDFVVSNLKEALERCMQEKNEYFEEAENNSKELTTQVDFLKQQLQECVITLEKQNRSGVSAVEHMQLKNKLMQLQLDQTQMRENLESCKKRLSEKSSAFIDLQKKHNLMVNVYNETKEKHLKELVKRDEMLHKERFEFHQSVEEFQMQLKKQERSEELIKNLEVKLNEAGNEKSSLLGQAKRENEERDEKIQCLMNEIRILTSEVSQVRLEKERSLAENELKTEELGKRHSLELEELKATHESQLTLITKEIDNMEQENLKIRENMSKILDEGIKGRRELEEKQLKNKSLLEEIDKIKLQSAEKIAELEEKKQLSFNEMIEQLKQFQNESQSLESEVGHLKANEKENEILCQQLNELLEREKMNGNKLSEAKKCLEEEVSDLRGKIKHLKDVVIAKDCKQRELEDQLEKEKKEKNGINISTQEITLINDSLRIELESKTNELGVAVKDRNMLSETKTCLEEEASDLRGEVKHLKDVAIVKDCKQRELESQLEKEKKEKNEINISIQEITLINDSLRTELETKTNELEVAVKDKESFNQRNLEIEHKLKERGDEIQSLSSKLTGLANELTDKTELEKQVLSLNKELLILKSTLANFQQYKNDLHGFNERMINLIKVLSEKEKSLLAVEGKNNLNENVDYTDPLSLLESKVEFISSRLDESKSHISVEFPYTPQQQGENIVPLSMYECQTELNRTVVSDDRSTIRQVCVSCQTSVIPTEEQGFQTSLSKNISGLLASETIEEDCLIEEVMIIPKRISGSTSLKNLKEIGAAATATEVSSATLEYEQLRSKYYGAQFMIKSLENENSHLKRALKFKKSSTQKETPIEKNNEDNVEVLESNAAIANDKEKDCIELLKVKHECEATSCKQASKDLRESILSLMKEKLEMLKREKTLLGKIEVLKQSIASLLDQNSGKLDKVPRVTSEETEISLNRGEPVSKISLNMANCAIAMPKCLDLEGENGIQSNKIEEFVGTSSVAALDAQSVGEATTELHTPLFENLEPDEEKHSVVEGTDNQSLGNTLTHIHRNIWETKLEIAMHINKSLEEELKVKFSSALETYGTASEGGSWQMHLAKFLRLYVESRHPYFQKENPILANVFEGWEDVLRSEGSGFCEALEDSKREIHERDDSPGEGIFADLLREMRKVVSEQKQFQKMLKDLENHVIAHLEKRATDFDGQNWTPTTEMVNPEGICGRDTTSVPKPQEAIPVNVSSFYEETLHELLREFEEVTSAIVDKAQEEKIELLENQRSMMMKMLLENQAKISEICSNQLKALMDISLEDIDAGKIVQVLAENIDLSLNEELVFIENEYEELLKQYSHEQSMQSQSHSHTLKEFSLRINSLLQQTQFQVRLPPYPYYFPLRLFEETC